jgi:hypothetical protein
MFWRKLILINMVIIYLTIKLYGLMWFTLTRSDAEKINLFSDKLNCNITKNFEINDVLSSKFDQLRVSKINVKHYFFKFFISKFDIFTLYISYINSRLYSLKFFVLILTPPAISGLRI